MTETQTAEQKAAVEASKARLAGLGVPADGSRGLSALAEIPAVYPGDVIECLSEPGKPYKVLSLTSRKKVPTLLLIGEDGVKGTIPARAVKRSDLPFVDPPVKKFHHGQVLKIIGGRYKADRDALYVAIKESDPKGIVNAVRLGGEPEGTNPRSYWRFAVEHVELVESGSF